MKYVYIPFLVISVLSTSMQAMDWLKSASSNSKTLKIVAIGSVSGVTAYTLGKYVHNKYFAYQENVIVDASVDAIITMCMPYVKVLQLPENERLDILRKKARLINIRKRVLAALEEKLIGTSFVYSNGHRNALQRLITAAKIIFGPIDALRSENPYEEEYAIASYLDQIIENNIVASVVLSTKPKGECSIEDLAKRCAFAHRRTLILKKLHGKINDFLYNGLANLL